MYQLTWIDSAGFLYTVTNPSKETLWNLRFHLGRAKTGVKARLWNRQGKLVRELQWRT